MDLVSYFRVLRRRWWLIAFCVVLGGGLGWATTVVSGGSGTESTVKTTRQHYKATHIFLTAPESDNTYPTSFTNLDQMALLATTGPVPDAVAKQLGGSSSGLQLAERITTLTNDTTGTLAITAVDADPTRATQLAEAFADQLSANLTAQDLARYQKATSDAETQLTTIQGKIDAVNAQLAATAPPANADALRTQLDTLQSQYADATDAYQGLTATAAPASPLTTLQQATPVPISASDYAAKLSEGKRGENNQQAGSPTTEPTVASSSGGSLDSTSSRMIVGALLGLFAGLGLASLLERLDRRIRTHDDAEAAFGVPVLADVPALRGRDRRERVIIAVTKPFSPAAEAYRAVRSSLMFQQTLIEGDFEGGGDTNGADARNRPLVLMVTSAAPQDGKSTSSANLAAVFAEDGSSVLVVNCDFRRPMIHRFFGVSDEPRRVYRTSVPGVKVVSNVTVDADANPARVIAEQRHVVSVARERFDVIILDTAPVLSANDALELAKDADFVVLISRAAWSKYAEVQRSVEMLDRVRAPVVGCILVGAGDAENYYYSYSGALTEELGQRARRSASSNGHRDAGFTDATRAPEELTEG